MKIAIDIAPIQDLNSGHRVRGVGAYITGLKNALARYDTKNEYLFFAGNEKSPGDADIVHYPYFDPFFLTLPLIKKTKTVVTVHDLTPLVFPDHFPSGLKGAARWFVQKQLLKHVDAVVVDSESSKHDVNKFIGIPLPKIDVVYLAAGEEFKQLDLSKSEKDEMRKKYNLPEKFTLYVGDVTWNKNLPRLIEAMDEQEIHLVLVGKAIAQANFDIENPWNADLVSVKKMIAKSHTAQVLGYVSTDDLVKLYNMATVFVMPSLYEGFGLPVVEAMVCGCPVVTTKEGSLHEVAGDAAVFVDASDTKSIGEGVKRVFSDLSLQQSYRKKGVDQAKKFSWEKTALEMKDIYEKVFRNR